MSKGLKNTFDSTCGKKSRCKVNLNDAKFISIDEGILLNSDTETIYNRYDIQMNNTETKVDTSIKNGIEQTEDFLNSFEITDSTSIASLPYEKAYAERFYVENVDLSRTLNNYHLQNELRNQQDTNTDEGNDEINEDIPLKVLLRRMFDKILGNHTNTTKEVNTIHSNETSITECSFKSCSSLNSEFDNRSDINNNESTTIPIMFMSDHNKSVSPVPYIFTYPLLHNKLVTVMENSNENTTSSYAHSSFDSGKCISKLMNPLLKSKQCLDVSIFTINNTIDNEDETDSSIYSNTDVTNKKCYSSMKIFTDISTNNEEYNASSSENLEMTGKEGFMETINHSTETETNSSHSRFEESDYSSSHEESSNKTVSFCDNLGDTYIIVVKRTPVANKSKTKRRSLSFPRESTKGYDDKKILQNSNCIVSPIKPVNYLKSLFTDIANKNISNMRRTPIRHVIRPKVPFISITPSTPTM